MNIMKVSKSNFFLGAIVLMIALIFLILAPIPSGSIAHAQTAPSGPCTSNQVTSVPAWTWVAGILYGCPVGATNQNWSPMWTASTDTTIGITLSSTNLTTMFTTPVSVLPAPLANQVIRVDSMVFEMIATSTAYTGGGVINLVYHGGAVNPLTGTVAASVVTVGSAGTVLYTLGPLVPTTASAITAGVGIDITNATAVFAAGTGTAKVHIKYRTINL